ncbi:ubiquinol-cytochrome c reductase iron-sulfur subunit [Candidatus Berkiella cookevillensis]|uniref:Ubiquinol-cytochrome c reductase iron-sulfur subunit n=1 Tax=Candidatus Berkiella cookevillensis TaxID=437022 RepID=A0A0Q9YMJ5_9GAMM|nr:ubiquinol-cytochrome c reductase iron-sulfur subunit [Candidatus Berkiella cookevillensis]MCS5709209.1 ubiquinol-cytochrome c reductase iron-sulfur subunit [Candidatus Berkiella cookevillensis]
MSDESIDRGRRRFLTGATSVIGGIGALYAAAPFIGSWFPSAKAQALGAPVKVDLNKLSPGAQLTIEWRGQPIWIIRRTESTVDGLKKLDSQLRDPQSTQAQQPAYITKEYRSIKPEYLILVGLCTHLGCVPMYRPEAGSVEAGWQGGFFCPCHGSKFDLAGRVFKGVPAPTNLLVPPHRYASDTVVVIGEDEKA